MKKNQIDLCIGTPMHDGGCAGGYARSLFHLGYSLGQAGISAATMYGYHDSVAQARSRIASEFLESSCTHLFFVDSDIEFDAGDALFMLALAATTGSPYDVITAAYPKKKFPVEQNFNTIKPVELNNQPQQILDNGCGFMLIRRATLERLERLHPELAYTHHDGRRVIRFFQDGIVDGGTFLAEDRWFCRLVRSAGMQIWLCPWIKLNHIGTHTFEGDLAKAREAREAAE